MNVYAGEGRAPEYLALNPLGQIPTLVDSALVLRESNAILQYLAEAHDAELAGRTLAERGETAQWLFWEASQWQPALATTLSGVVGHRLLPAHVPAPEATVDWETAPCAPLLEALERHLEGRSHLVGERLGIADFGVAGMTTYFRAASFPFDAHPHVSAWLDRLARVPAWSESLADLWRIDAA